MSSLQVFGSDFSSQFTSEFKINTNGEVTTSVRGAARIAGVEHSSLMRVFQSGAQKPSRLSQILADKGFDTGAQISWSKTGIPEVAVSIIVFYYAYKAGQYCNETAESNAELISSIGLRALIQKSLGWQQPQQTEHQAISQEAANLALMLGEYAGMDKSLSAQLAMNAAVAVNPALKPVMDSIKVAIACSTPSDDAFLNPTKIGESLGMSARAVNSWLINSGLQYRTNDKKTPYRPTESGKRWAKMISAVSRDSEQTVFQLRWAPEIIDVIRNK